MSSPVLTTGAILGFIIAALYIVAIMLLLFVIRYSVATVLIVAAIEGVVITLLIVTGVYALKLKRQAILEYGTTGGVVMMDQELMKSGR